MPVGPATVQSALNAVDAFARGLATSVGRRGAPREVEGHLVAEDGSEFDVVLVMSSGAQRARAGIGAAAGQATAVAGAAAGAARLAATQVVGVLRDPAGSLVGRLAPGGTAAVEEGHHPYHYQVRFPDGSVLEGDGDVVDEPAES